MILIDYSQIAISNIAVQLAMSKDKMTLSIPIVRHMILNSIRGLVHRFKQDYPGDVIIAVDGPAPWRRDIFPNYKHQRRKGRVESQIDWDGLFKIMSEIREEFITKLPYKVLHVEKTEADDIIATLVAQQTENLYLIISGDKDFQQLQKYPSVSQYAPIQKKMIETQNPQEYIFEHIMRGDTSDGIPNFLSPDDTFVNKIKQKPIQKKKLSYWIDTLMKGEDPKTFCNEYHYRNYQRNQRLIDFDYIPDDMEEDIYNTKQSIEELKKYA